MNPFVSALLVTYNEEEYIKESLLSLINQTYPRERYEIIVIDGMSEDQTMKIVNDLAGSYQQEGYCIRSLTNEKKVLAAGWNLGIRNARGEYVVRIDAHAKACPDFIQKSVETMGSVPDAMCVGGKLMTASQAGCDEVVSKVLSSSFGVGNSSFRVSDTAGYADTAVYGLYRKEIFDKAGYFDESLVRNQDIELHARIRNAGGRFYFNPEIKSVYYARNTVRKMLKQAFQNGKWNPVVRRKNKSALSVRHLVPFAFVTFTGVTTVLGFFQRFFWYLETFVLTLHLCLGLMAAKKKTHHLSEIVRMPVLFMLLHLAYGTGYLFGLFYKREKEEKKE